MSRAAVQNPTRVVSQDSGNEAVATPQRAETPQEFYRRITQRPEIRDLLRRLAKR